MHILPSGIRQLVSSIARLNDTRHQKFIPSLSLSDLEIALFGLFCAFHVRLPAKQGMPVIDVLYEEHNDEWKLLVRLGGENGKRCEHKSLSKAIRRYVAEYADRIAFSAARIADDLYIKCSPPGTGHGI